MSYKHCMCCKIPNQVRNDGGFGFFYFGKIATRICSQLTLFTDLIIFLMNCKKKSVCKCIFINSTLQFLN